MALFSNKRRSPISPQFHAIRYWLGLYQFPFKSRATQAARSPVIPAFRRGTLNSRLRTVTYAAVTSRCPTCRILSDHHGIPKMTGTAISLSIIEKEYAMENQLSRLVNALPDYDLDGQFDTRFDSNVLCEGETVTETKDRCTPEISTPTASLESILCTEELRRRPSRAPEYEKENRALGELAGALADSPS